MLDTECDAGVIRRADALLDRATDLLDLHDPGTGRAVVEALAAAAESGLPRQRVRAEALATRSALLQGQPDRAVRHALAAAEHAGREPDPLLAAEAVLAEVRVMAEIDEVPEALAALETHWPVIDADGPAWLRRECQELFAVLFERIDTPDEHACIAATWYSSAQHTAQLAGLTDAAAASRARAAQAWLDHGDRLAARDRAQAASHAYEQGLALTDGLGDDGPGAADVAQAAGVGSAPLMIIRGGLLQRLDRHPEAAAVLQRAQHLLADADRPELAVRLGHEQARLLRHTDLTAAGAACGRGLAAHDRDRRAVPGHRVRLLRLAAEIAQAQGDLAAALAHLRAALRVRDQWANAAAHVRSRVLAARLGTDRAVAEAAEHRERAAELTVANAELELAAQSLTQQAQSDALTRLANRRHLDVALAAAHAAAQAQDTPLCVALLDIDHFKKVNDTFSHAVGDAVLTQVGALMRQQCRPQDVPARYGGEEFVVVLRDIGRTRAQAVCERLRAAVEAHDWTTIAPGLAVTISIGVCDIGADPDPAVGLSRADGLLYEAKRGGRNQVVCR